ncbi:MAG: hypothetical protein EBT91_01350 [Rhodobacteraceae bacterium]|nr:hypothetical protein [Paracoccaceae bacterium]
MAPVVQVSRNYALADAIVRIPADLTVSEANRYYPLADIVWRGDPPGDRHAQVANLFINAVELAKPGLAGAVPVIAEITLVRFHGVTEKTRATVGGVYNIVFTLAVRDAGTGAVLEPAREIEADLAAPGGTAALLLEREGQTEVVRVTDFLSYVLVKELGGLAR